MGRHDLLDPQLMRIGRADPAAHRGEMSARPLVIRAIDPGDGRTADRKPRAQAVDRKTDAAEAPPERAAWIEESKMQAPRNRDRHGRGKSARPNIQPPTPKFSLRPGFIQTT